MIINMTTVASRPKHYIDRTLESLFQSDGRDIPLNLILGSSDTSHVEQYRNVANVVAWDEEAESQARRGNLRRNCNVNAIRALRYGDDDYCLCCEDDVIFDANWFSQLMLTVAEIDRQEYVLNLGQRGDRSPGKRYATHTQRYLCGAQGIFYPSKRLRNAVAKYRPGKHRRQHERRFDRQIRQAICRVVQHDPGPDRPHWTSFLLSTHPTHPVNRSGERRLRRSRGRRRPSPISLLTDVPITRPRRP